ncbi:hypothetical protein OUZ56_010343 [Daphnia magna]|uniref:Uncharacterized protein n=1 Tax=Daphnia magna TaxID=35525 RepID=A0ABR0AIE5_9CRUS|nr:hypothetical protein OUZ56_010343 [Daphnia magna]
MEVRSLVSVPTLEHVFFPEYKGKKDKYVCMNTLNYKEKYTVAPLSRRPLRCASTSLKAFNLQLETP